MTEIISQKIQYFHEFAWNQVEIKLKNSLELILHNNKQLQKFNATPLKVADLLRHDHVCIEQIYQIIKTQNGRNLVSIDFQKMMLFIEQFVVVMQGTVKDIGLWLQIFPDLQRRTTQNNYQMYSRTIETRDICYLCQSHLENQRINRIKEELKINDLNSLREQNERIISEELNECERQVEASVSSEFHEFMQQISGCSKTSIYLQHLIEVGQKHKANMDFELGSFKQPTVLIENVIPTLIEDFLQTLKSKLPHTYKEKVSEVIQTCMNSMRKAFASSIKRTIDIKQTNPSSNVNHAIHNAVEERKQLLKSTKLIKSIQSMLGDEKDKLIKEGREVYQRAQAEISRLKSTILDLNYQNQGLLDSVLAFKNNHQKTLKSYQSKNGQLKLQTQLHLQESQSTFTKIKSKKIKKHISGGVSIKIKKIEKEGNQNDKQISVMSTNKILSSLNIQDSQKIQTKDVGCQFDSSELDYQYQKQNREYFIKPFKNKSSTKLAVNMVKAEGVKHDSGQRQNQSNKDIIFNQKYFKQVGKLIVPQKRDEKSDSHEINMNKIIKNKQIANSLNQNNSSQRNPLPIQSQFNQKSSFPSQVNKFNRQSSIKQVLQKLPIKASLGEDSSKNFHARQFSQFSATSNENKANMSQISNQYLSSKIHDEGQQDDFLLKGEMKPSTKNVTYPKKMKMVRIRTENNDSYQSSYLLKATLFNPLDSSKAMSKERQNNVFQERENKSNKHVQHNLTKPQTVKQENNYIFNLADLMLFGGVADSYKYEQQYQSAPNKQLFCEEVLSKQKENFIDGVCKHVLALKLFKDISFSQNVISFLLKPYQTIHQMAVQTNISVSESLLKNKLRAIFKVHQTRCNSTYCLHLLGFFDKIGLPCKIQHD